MSVTAAVVGGTGLTGIALASPASATGQFVSPSSAFTVGADASGNPLPTDVVTTNFPAATNVFLIVCDGVPPTTQGYDATQHCDNTAGQGPIQSQGTTYQERFTVANSNREVTPFRGLGGSQTFNCLAPEDVKQGATPNAGMGDVVPIGSTTKNGNTIDTSAPSWDDCQMRVSSNNSATTTDQAYLTFTLSNSPQQVKATPTISGVSGNPTSSTYGGSVVLSTTVSAPSGNSTAPSGGGVAFAVNGNPIAGCQAVTPTYSGTSGTATCTTSALPVGSADSLTATYSGDPNYTTVTSQATSYTVNKAAATSSLASQPANSANQGASVTFTDTVTGVAGGAAPTGTVTFKDGSTTLCSGPQTLTAASPATSPPTATATCQTSAVPTGSSQSISASYSGDGNYSAGTPGTESFSVNPLPTPTVNVTFSPQSPVTYGTADTATAVITPPNGSNAAPGGKVNFSIQAGNGSPSAIAGCQNVSVSSGQAPCALPTSPPLAAGSYTVIANYLGDGANYGAASNSGALTINPAPTSLALTASPTTQGQGNPVQLTATATTSASGAGTPAGTVSFQYNGTAIAGCGSQPLTTSGGTTAATCTTSALPNGPDTVTAVDTPGSNFAAPSSNPTTSVTVNPLLTTTTNVTAQPPSPSTFGTPVTFTAVVAGPDSNHKPTGSVTFSNGSSPINGCSNLAVSPSNETATCVTSSLPQSNDTVNAVFTDGPDANGSSLYSGSSGSTAYTVNAPPYQQLAKGYHLVASDGGVFSFGGAHFYGSEGGKPLAAPVVGLAESADNQGYWLVASDGGVFAFGDAPFEGSLGSVHLNAPIVGIAPTADGRGYWLVASDGGVFAFGDALFEGSLGSVHLNAPIIGIASTGTGQGYWLAGSDGGVFSFGDAHFHGSLGNVKLTKPIVGMAGTAVPGSAGDKDGYWMTGADGGVFAFGDATYAGSMGGTTLAAPVVGVAEAPEGGYRLGAADGGVFNFGGAGSYGSMGGTPLAAPIVGIASTGGRYYPTVNFMGVHPGALQQVTGPHRG